MTFLDPRPAPSISGRDAAPLPRLDPITRLPILILFPHNRCNCRCLMCDIWKLKDPVEIGAEDVARWLAEWRALGVERVVLSGGEALMHSNLWELCRRLRAEGIGITLLSSGLLVARDAVKIAEHVDDLVLSLDGPREIHDEIRNVPRAYGRLVEGVEAVRATGKPLSISARCTVQKKNFRRLRDTVSAAREAGLERISFLAADVSSEAFNRPDGPAATGTAAVALSREDLPALASELDLLERENRADFESGFIAESPEKLRTRLLRYFSALLGETDFAPNECNAPWVSSVIEADGTVRPCFFHAPLGNVKDAGSLRAVLNSPKALEFRRGLDVATNPVCLRCVCTLRLEQG